MERKTFSANESDAKILQQGHQHGARGHQVDCKDHVGRPRARFENRIKMMGVIT